MPDAAAREDDDLTAAEAALRLIDGADGDAVRLRAANDPGFADAVARWDERLSPLFAEIAPIAPPDAVWRRIAAQLDDPVMRLQRRVRQWRWTSAALGAVAATLAVLLLRPVAPPPVAVPVVPLLAVAQLSDPQGKPLLAVGIERRSGEVRVRMHDLPRQELLPELWIIPAGGAPQSLGPIGHDGMLAIRLPAALRGETAGPATLAISMEQAAGMPHAAPAGPIVATGTMIAL
ncbi:anti-sigma factor domain-containing protein [Sphingomonas sp. Leaf25]|uniref:anti-sigma factor n=1 Tax=Sphingomonas sp. Leaf25 TaxID=1735692 RepID=UPI0006FB595F|nr:anti-sigma factor [Sphingomonas sp. Leaf25]KQM98883.1 hypothetical protein ASE78_06635 [Sphingomonas sp. Leaf25]